MLSKTFGLVVIALLGTSPAWAQNGACGTPAQTKELEKNALASGYDVALSTVRRCYGDSVSDTAPLVTTFNAATPDTKTADARLTAVRSALTTLRDAATLRELQGVDTPAWREVATELNAALERSQAAADQTGSPARIASGSLWNLPPNNTAVLPLSGVQLAITNCAKPPAACPVYASRVDLIRVVNLMERLEGYAEFATLEVHFNDAKLMNARWDAYFNKALPQYWWEVAINGERMGTDLCPEDSSGMQLGFCKVPESQLIVLHPSAGLQWVRGADDEDDLAPAFVVEVFGRNSWNWDGSTAAMKGQFGWSVVAAYSNPNGDQKNWSYGVMVHKGPSLNLGVTTAGSGQVSVLVSINLAEMFFTRKKEYLDYFKALRKEPWTALL